MHKIKTEEGAKPTREGQRRLNPPMMDVVKEKIQKLLDADIVYPISDNNWIPVAPEDQENKTFTCPFRTLAYRRMPFGLCNAPTTFQRAEVFDEQEGSEAKINSLDSFAPGIRS
ncbi:uncharacterized protein LOC120204481 [Hibiscus syriacus]|uniref:uncharacterized protein LOC120204481 n=1 Tax=Hibiscus syriacus TaxID=106335 RepID=UPI0019247C44|nr:uncharacterized protein LOC120204481 [Hibiscus syriacus]